VIERNERRAGVLIKFDEDPLWKYRADFVGDSINAEEIERIGLITYDQLAILPFSEKQVRKDSNLLQQFTVAKDLLEGYIKGERSISEVFDVSLLAKFNAICNILGGDHLPGYLSLCKSGFGFLTSLCCRFRRSDLRRFL